MNSRTLLTLLGLSLSLSACDKAPPAPGTATPPNGGATTTQIVRIGSVAPLTGPQSHIGKDNENGARLAIDEFNNRGLNLGGQPVKLELLSEDDQADPKTATIVAQKLADQRVAGVIGHLNSGTSIPAAKIYFDHGIAQISPSATAIPYTAQNFNTAFRVMTNDEQQGSVLGEFAVKSLGATKIAVIDDRTAYGQGLSDEFVKAATAAGGTIVTRQYTTDRATDFMAILTTIKGKNPDLIFFGGMDAQGAPLIKQLQQLGIQAKFLGGDGVQTKEFIRIAGRDAENAYASSPGLPLATMPGGQEFATRYEAKYGKIQIYAPYAYDATRALILAMEKAGSADPKKYLPALAQTNFEGVTGPIRFDHKGDIAGGAVTLYQVKNGQWEALQTVRRDTASAPAGP